MRPLLIAVIASATAAEGVSGLTLVLGAQGTDAPQVVASAAGGTRLVHVLARDAAAVTTIRAAVDQQHLGGIVSAEVMPAALPYTAEVADQVVVCDPAAVPGGEAAIRALVAVGGTLQLPGGATWTRPAVPGRDVWTHPNHGPDGNRSSSDTTITLPMSVRWQAGLPMNPWFSNWAATRAVVACGGLVYSLGTSDPANLAASGVAGGLASTGRLVVQARAMGNGLLRWRHDCGPTTALYPLASQNSEALVAAPDRVWVGTDAGVRALAAADGTTLAQTALPGRCHALLHDGGVVMAAWSTQRERGKDAEIASANGLWAPLIVPGGEAGITGLDPQTLAVRWEQRLAATTCLASQGLLVALTTTGNPITAQEVVALDAATGGVRWRTPHSTVAPELGCYLRCLGPGIAIIGRPRTKQITALSLTDGSVLWHAEGAGHIRGAVRMHNGLVWSGSRLLDPRTGAVSGVGPGDPGDGMCSPSTTIGALTFASRSGSVTGNLKLEGLRGGCVTGLVVAEGGLFLAQNDCRCSPAQLPGFLSLAPATPPDAAAFTAARPRSAGTPAPAPATLRPVDWNTWDGNAERSAASASPVPAQPRLRWHSRIAQPATGPVAAERAQRLLPRLGQPVAAAGTVCIAATDAQAVVALDLADGRERWRLAQGARVVTAPTLDGSRCYFGADDGWIRAVGLRDGAAAWSVRAAPAERRIVAFAGLASPWPVPGSVLVHGGRVYASAGRSSEADGGLAVLCLDAADGSQRWASGIAPGPRLLNDLLRWQDGELRLHDLRLDPLQGTDLNAAALAKVKRTGNLDGLVDPTWTRLGNRRSGLVRRGILAGDLVAWDASLAVSWNSAKPRGLAGHGIDVLADPPPAPEPPPGTKPTPPVVPSVWRLDLPPGTQVEALALGADGIAAVLRQARGDTATGVLLIVGRDGLERARIDLPAPGAVHGLALADGVILVALEDGTLTCWGG